MSRGEVHGSTPLPARAALAATSAITAGTVAGGSAASGISSTGSTAVTATLAAMFVQAVAPAQVAAAREPSGPKLRKAVGAGIHGLVPLQAAWIARGGAPRLGAALIAALPLARTLARKISPT
jgi:4-hydroxybenzoate polyprenyltransferase